MASDSHACAYLTQFKHNGLQSVLKHSCIIPEDSRNCQTNQIHYLLIAVYRESAYTDTTNAVDQDMST